DSFRARREASLPTCPPQKAAATQARSVARNGRSTFHHPVGFPGRLVRFSTLLLRGTALMLKRFKDLSEKEIVAVAIANEEEDGRIYGEFADALRDSYPATAEMFEEMRVEEAGHRDRLLALFRQRFGDHIPPIRREDVRGFLKRRPVWMTRPLGVKVARRQAEIMEMEASRFYSRAASMAADAPTRELLNMLADEERKHTRAAGEYEEKHLTEKAKSDESESHKRLYLLQIVQPGLLGLIDGSISTLAPLFAAAFATQNSWKAFLVGLAASIGAGISMGFAESQSDDGSLTGRGSPWIRGAATGFMTMAGGIGHTLPFLISDFHIATIIAVIVVFIELGAISYVRYRYMDTPFWQAAFLSGVGGLLVFITGWLIGSS
ncbi:MAG TPA: ferritin family protein, partial [Terriglobia bacterium]|nr:ferritin family protein [Terriglobia bacterium]